MVLNSALELVGNTPHLKLNKLFGANRQVYIKLERQNIGGSIKDRIALAMIEDAEKRGVLKTGGTIIEATSGNTGIGLALVAAVKSYKIILVMPESMSVERRRIMSAYGAQLDLTPREKGMKGAIARAEELLAQTPGAWMPEQFNNHANVEVHQQVTAMEIAKDFPKGIDYLITGVGTGGHITGCAQALKKQFPNLKVLAVEPALSPVLSGGQPGPHPLQGIGAGFVPSIMNTSVLDGIITIGKDEAFEYARRIVKEEGVLVGISTGAALAAVAKTLPTIPEGSVVLTFNYDTGERYLSIDDLF